MRSRTELSLPLLLRIAMLVVAVVAAPLMYREMNADFERDRFSWLFLFELIGFAIVGVTFTTFLQYVNPASTGTWEKPSWRSSFIDRRQPIAMFHFGGYFFTVLAISLAIYTALIGSSSPLFELPLGLGIGAIAGAKLSLLLFRDKFDGKRET